MFKTKKTPLSVWFESDIEQEEEPEAESSNPPRQKKSKGKGKWFEFTALASIPLVLVLGNSMLIPILPELKAALHVNQFQTSLVITLFSFTAGLFIPVTGYLSDRFGRKIIIIPSLAVYGAAGILAGFGAVWESYPVVIGARAIQGLGAAGTASIAMALIGDMYKGAKESEALGLIEASNGTGKVVSPILGALLALLIWYAAFFAFPAFCALSIIAVIWLIKEPKRKQNAPPLKKYMATILSIMKKKGSWLITSFFAGSLALFTLFGVLFYLSDILEKKPYNVDGVMKGLVLALPLFGMVISSYITGRVIKKNGLIMRWMMNVGLALSTVTFVLTIFFYENIYVFMSLLTLSSIGTGALLPCLNTMITSSVSKQERGMITSLYNSLRFLGVAFGPPVFSWLMGISHSRLFMTVSALSLIALGLVFFLIRPEKQLSGS